MKDFLYINNNHVLDWIQENNIEFEVLDCVINPTTFEWIPCKIRITNEKQYVWFMLRWS